MIKSISAPKSVKQKKFILLIILLSVFVLAFTFFKTFTNVYANAFLGALFEMAWLPWLLGLFVLPLLTVWHIYKTKTAFVSWIYLALFVQIISLLVLFFN